MRKPPRKGAPLTQRTGYGRGNYANNATFCAFLRVFARFWVDFVQILAFSPTPPALAPEGRGSATPGKLYPVRPALLLVRQVPGGNLVSHGIQDSNSLGAMI